RDWATLADDVEDSAEEMKKMSVRLRRRLASKAATGKHVGNPVSPGYYLPIVDRRRDGSFVFGKWEPYPPHQEVVVTVLKEFIRHRSAVKAVLALARARVAFPPFPAELIYMETRTALKTSRRTAERGYLT
ncbi:MAG TPA: hypothetical protein VI729_06675, partial [Anaerolineales bacterium]|nr:hypothetical protein [Anaerolineales bacterium]